MENKNKRTLNSLGEYQYPDIEPRIQKFIADQNLVVLRDAVSNVAMNVSYTPEGLEWTMAPNGSGRLIFFRKASIAKHYSKEDHSLTRLEIIGDKRPNSRYYVEKFIPMNHNTDYGQKAEYTWVAKAYRMALLGASNFS